MKLRLRSRGRGNYRTDGQPPAGQSETRMIIEDSDSEDETNWKKEFQPGTPAIANILIIILIGLSLIFVKRMDSTLPEPSRATSVVNTSLTFSEARARINLEALTSVGVRISGSEVTDVLTVQNIVNILASIRNSTNGHYSLDIDVQRPSGAFEMEDNDGGHTSVYMEISNVVAKLEPKNDNIRTNDSILVNCHFDTKPASPGASDNMISCVTMLEIIQVLYHNEDEENVLPNTIVFLFNGAEELGLQGAHGFVRGDGWGHPWSNNLRCFINLEGAGAGGREILFQTGPGNSWIADAYAKVAKHPYGTVLAEEAFQMGLIPSDTDFRIFRDFANIPGLDMAFTKNGWVYHTKWDRVTEITPGSIQNMGDNAITLVEYLGNLNFEDVKMEKSGTNMVFFDVFGIFMVCYNETSGIITHILVATIFSILTIIEVRSLRIKSILTITLLLVSSVVAWGAGVGAGSFAGAFLNWIGFYKPFYSYPFMTIVLFGVPAIFAQSLVYSFFWKGSQKKSWLAGKFAIAILLFAMSYIVRSAYIFSLILVFAILAWLPRHLIFKKPRRFPVAEVVSTLIIGELIPFLFTSYLTITLIDVFVPIMGRSGTETDPNVFLGVVIAAITSVLTFHGIGTYFVGFKKIYLIAGLLLSVFVINPMIATGFIGKIPYQEKTPMRIQILDTDRTWYNSDMTENRTDAGYFFWPLDGNTIDFLPEFAKTLPQIRDYVELEANEDSCPDLYCNQQFFWPTGKSIKKTPWVSKSYGLPYSLKDQVKMKIEKNEGLDPEQGHRRLTLAFQGPTQNTIVFSPATNLRVKSWSLNTRVESMGDLSYLGRPMYFIYVGKGYQARERDFRLSVILEKASNDSEVSVSEGNELMDVMLVGHFMHDAHQWNFKEFVQKFPVWTSVTSWTSILKQYKISA